MGTQYRNKKTKSLPLYPVDDEKYWIYNDHHTGVLSSTEITDFSKLQDTSRDIQPIEHVRDEKTGAVQYIIHRKGYDDILTYQEGRKLELKDILVLDYILELAAPLVEKNKEAFKVTISYDKYFKEVRKKMGTGEQRQSLIDSLEKLGGHMISCKRVTNSGEVTEGVTPFNMFTADYKIRGGVEIFINPLYNRYFLQRSSAKPRSKVIQRMDTKHDAVAIEIMRALDTQMGSFDPHGVDENGNKFWRITVKELLKEITSLKRAKEVVFDLIKGLPPIKEEEPVKEEDRERPSDVHKIMIPFIEGMNKCTVDYSGTRGLLSWKFVRPGGLALSLNEREQVTYNGPGKPTKNLKFKTFVDMTIEYYPFDPPNMRPRAARMKRQENIIKGKQIKKSKKKED